MNTVDRRVGTDCVHGCWGYQSVGGLDRCLTADRVARVLRQAEARHALFPHNRDPAAHLENPERTGGLHPAAGKLDDQGQRQRQREAADSDNRSEEPDKGAAGTGAVEMAMTVRAARCRERGEAIWREAKKDKTGTARSGDSRGGRVRDG